MLNRDVESKFIAQYISMEIFFLTIFTKIKLFNYTFYLQNLNIFPQNDKRLNRYLVSALNAIFNRVKYIFKSFLSLFLHLSKYLPK